MNSLFNIVLDSLSLQQFNKLSNTFRVEFDGKHVSNKYAFVTLQNVFNKNNVGDFETRTGGYSLVNLGFGATIKAYNQPFNIKLSANNLFDKEYVSHLSRLKPDGIYNIGRNINIGVTVPQIDSQVTIMFFINPTLQIVSFNDWWRLKQCLMRFPPLVVSDI